MNKFKFTGLERKRVFDLFTWKMPNDQVEDLIYAIETIISEREQVNPVPSIPTHYGDGVASDQTDMAGAEAWELVEGVIGRCTCDVAYVSRQMTDPNCRWCDYHVDLIELLTTYADAKVAEANANWAEEKLHLINSIKRLQSELSEKDEKIKYWVDWYQRRVIECARREKEIQHLTAKCEALITELDAVNESLTGLIRKNAEMEKEAEYLRIR